MWALSKISAPGWEKSFSDEVELYDELLNWICSHCLIEFFEQYNHLPIDAEDLIWTACGAEFMIEEFDENCSNI